MANPVFQAAGAPVASTGPITVAWPAHEVDDVALLFVETANQAVTLSTPAGFTEITNQGTGTAGASSATRLTVFWARATSTAMASPVVADSGARQTGVILTYRGCIASGNPYDVFAGGVQATADAAVSIPGLTTTVAETLIVNALSNSLGVAATTVRPSSVANASLSNIAKRLNTQADGTGGGGATSTSLPVGLMGFGAGGDRGEVGQGPGLDFADPRCKVLLFVPNITDIGSKIDTADQHDILLLLNVAGNKGAWTTTVNGTVTLDMGKYEANVRKYRPTDDNTAFPDRLKFADAVRRKRVLLYVVDEPNLRNADNPSVPDISPTQVNQMALIHKAVWPDGLTIVRAAANTLNGGWAGLSKPSGGYTGVDYCWLQYNNNHAKGASGSQPWTTPNDPRDVWEEQRNIIAQNNLNMGLCVSMNLYVSGIGQDFLGVSARWDVGNDGGPLNYLLGDREAARATEVTTLLDSYRSLCTSPDWIKKFADLATADADAPFLMYWQHATATNPSNEFQAFYERADFQAAFDYAINKGLTRTVSNGLRTPKNPVTP